MAAPATLWTRLRADRAGMTGLVIVLLFAALALGA